jgi:hypothetical protein
MMTIQKMNGYIPIERHRPFLVAFSEKLSSQDAHKMGLLQFVGRDIGRTDQQL